MPARRPRSVLRRLVLRIAGLSARRVAGGGETGAWRWVVPALAIAVLVLMGQRVLVLNAQADDARAISALAQGVATDVALGQDRRIVLGHLDELRAQQAGDADVQQLAEELSTAGADVRRTAAITNVIDQRYAARAAARQATARNASAFMLALGLGLALLLLWTFWSRRSAAQAELHHRRFRSLVQNSSDLILVVDDRGLVTECTPVVEQMLGRRPEDLLGTRFDALVHPDDDFPLGGGLRTAAWRAAHAGGAWVDVESTSTDLREDPSVEGIVLVVRDVRERKVFEERLQHAAFHDALTGLPNRVLFEDRVHHALARARRTEATVAVLFVDLDDFKTVNDSLGHLAGDDLLRQTAARLDESLRGGDTAARLGGDEFAVLVEEVAAVEDVTAVAGRVLEALDRAFRVGDEEIFMRASVGIAIGERDQRDQDLLRNADTAMYAAKSAGKGRYELFDAGMHVDARRRLQLTGDLRRAVDREEFSVDYQPLVDLASGRILGAEALVRWEHPELGRIAPDSFIPLAEETGLIVAIGDFVLRKACLQARAWQDQSEDRELPAYVSVNLSPRQFRPPGRLVEQVSRVTAEAGLDPSCLLLEITEGVLINESDRQHAARDLQALRDIGVRVAIDDFGTGYSSLAYLREFPLDIVKMDRTFVQEIGRGVADDALVRSVVELGSALGMKIVAEGIEDLSQLTSLRNLHCAMGQGYFFSQPVSGDAIASVIRNGHPAFERR